MMKLRDWIDINKIDWGMLSLNPHPYALELLKEKPDKIDWYWLSKNVHSVEVLEYLKENHYNQIIHSQYLSKNSNKQALELLKANPSKIDWYLLSLNTNDEAISLLKQNPDKIVWNFISLNSNSKALEMLKENPDKINWNYLCENSNPIALELIKENPDKINWHNLSLNENPDAIRLLKENPSKINWDRLCLNENPEAIRLLKENPSKIDWENLCLNKNAIDLLEENKNNINECIFAEDYYSNLSQNPSIFTYDYEGIKERNKEINEEIIMKSLHPKRMLRLMEEYGEDNIYDCYFS